MTVINGLIVLGSVVACVASFYAGYRIGKFVSDHT